jgi:hypothetical protein
MWRIPGQCIAGRLARLLPCWRAVRIYRFDEEVGAPRRDVGLGLRVSELTGDGSRVRVDVLHLAPGGSILVAQAVERRFLGVLTGAGRAAGAGVDRELGPWHGALWEPGERVEFHSRTALTAIDIQGDFEPAVMAVTQKITVRDYDPEWPHWFERLQSRLWPAVAGVALRIDHVGSTSVPGLAAKPIIDLDIVVASPADVDGAIARLEAIGYRWRGDLGVTGREAFRPPPDAVDPPHHLYVVVEDNKAHLDHWLLRDL